MLRSQFAGLLTLILLLFCPGSTYAGDKFLDSAEAILSHAPSDSSAIRFAKGFTGQCIAQGRYKDAEYFSRKVLALSEKNGRTADKAWALNHLGIVNYMRSDFLQSLSFYKQALELLRDLKDTRNEANVTYNIGMAEMNLGNYPEALKNDYDALELFGTLNDNAAVAETYNNIGNICLQQGSFDDALKNYRLYLKFCEKLNDSLGLARCYNNIAAALLEQAKRKKQRTERIALLDEALANNLLSLQLRTKINDQQGIVTSYNNIAQLKEENSRLETGPGAHLSLLHEALKYYELSLKQARAIEDLAQVACELYSLAHLHTQLGDFARAQAELDEALAVSKKTGVKEEIKLTYLFLSELDSAKGDLRSAYMHYRLFITYRDSLTNEENTRKMVQSQMQFEFDKKDAETKAEQEKKDALASEENRKQRMILWSVMGGLLLMLAFSVFMYRSYLAKKRTNREITLQKEVIEQKQKEILDSIHYARRIQRSLLPGEQYIARALKKPGK
ncbi:MAG TPA: tetratricopeptide repeat protein [Bacteroidia bacterium]|jgi:tetratricopeptide (TPR) repeat protein